jgi:hypothetical protein
VHSCYKYQLISMASSSSTTEFVACAQNNTIIGTVASRAYVPSLLRFASTAATIGFSCVVVQPMDELAELHSNPRLRVLGLPAQRLLPEPQWCQKAELKGSYGWRRSQFYKARTLTPPV